ncbi:MAG: hypothetical protein L0229_24930 [Blastocatellia bacterium]|nr:hypothetical protein [Blastocatellia bacterium]
MNSITRKYMFILTLALTGLAGWFSLPGHSLNSSANGSPATSGSGRGQPPPDTSITVRASGRGNPWINFRDGVDLPVEYAGAPHLEQALIRSESRPLALASADFDEDGVADLVCGYATDEGGVIALHSGNVDSIFPNSPEARERKAKGEFTDSPFLSSARIYEIAGSPNFLGAGDFEGDGHRDVVAASRGGSALHLISGDGRGGFGEERRIELRGRVTALATGEINRADGLDDVVVGIVGEDGAKALVFEGSEGALLSTPEIIALPGEARAIELGRLDGDYLMDMAVASPSDLLIVHGRDRQLSIGDGTAVPAGSISRRALPFIAKSMAIGDFVGDRLPHVALLAEDGSLHLASWSKSASKKRKKQGRKWKSALWARGPWTGATHILAMRLSSLSVDNLVMVDPINHQLRILTRQPQSEEGAAATIPQAVTIDVEGSPVAALPMRLNQDALSDLVILKSGQGTLATAMTQPQATFTVTNALDNTSDPPIPGSLRDAITQANASPGADLINFSIITVGVPPTISPLRPLPTITDSVTIDGTTVFAGAVELDGSQAGFATDGLNITSANNTIRGLIINRFSSAGIRLGPSINLAPSSGNTRIEKNLIGTDSNGNTDLGNDTGVSIDTSSGNIIGGTTTAARNIISGNDTHGIILQNGTSGTLVQGNFIGTNLSGNSALQNGLAIFIFNAAGNTVGGAIVNGHNLVSGNIGGIFIFGPAATGNMVQGNFIGTDVNGTADLGNDDDGIGIGGPNNTIGGTTTRARNIISGNDRNGIALDFGASGNFVQGNFIGTQADGTGPLGNSSHGVLFLDSASNNIIGGTGVTQGACNGPCNKIAFNGDSPNREGIHIISGTGNAVLGNAIFSNSELGIDLGSDDVVTLNDACDGDTEANNLQNFPELTSVTSTANSTTITGTLNSTANTTFAIEFFANTECDPSGNGEGETFIGSRTVTTGNDCDAPINVTLPVSVSAGQFITATATNLSTNDTSEFSNCIPVTSAGNADLAIEKTAAPAQPGAQVLPGSDIIYTIKVTNNGAGVANNVTVTDNLPPQTTFKSSSPQSNGFGNNRTFNLGSLAAGASQTVTITATVNAGVTVCSISNTASVTSSTPDTDIADNSATAETAISGAATLRLTGSSSLDFGATAAHLSPSTSAPSRTFTIENTGDCPRDVTFSINRTDTAGGKITDRNDSRFFMVFPGGSTTPATPGSTISILARQTMVFLVQFQALIPAPAGTVTNLPASAVLPGNIRSAITIQPTSSGAAPITVDLIASVTAQPALIPPGGPGTGPPVRFSRSGDNFTITFGVYHPDAAGSQGVTSATYQFFNNNDQPVEDSHTENLTARVRNLDLAPGQSFIVDQTGRGISDFPEITRVQVCISAGTGATCTFGALTAPDSETNASRSQTGSRARGTTLILPQLRLNPRPR